MATYTITLRELLSRGYQCFDNSWTTYDPSHKEELCNKILRRYYFYEIGSETADRFKFNLNEHLARIMPYYNQLYATEMLKIEPLYNYVLETDGDITRDKGTRRGTGNRIDSMRVKEIADSIKKLAEGTGNLVGNRNTSGSEDWTENTTTHETKVTDQDTSADGTKEVTFTGEEDTTGKETMQDDVTGDKTTESTSNTTTGSTKLYSDTPQGQITSEGKLGINEQYLTNYTRESGTSSTTEHGTEHIENHDTKVTDTTGKKNTSNTENTTTHEDGTNDMTETTDGTKKVVGNRNTSEKMDETEDTKTTSQEKTFSNGSEQNTDTTTSYTDESVKEDEKEKHNTITKGFTIAQSQLLKMYRDIIINIDSLIIEELASNFMGIF